MCDVVDKELTCFEATVQNKEWVEAMMGEYQSIMKNDVWEVVPQTRRKKCGIFQMDIQDKTYSQWKY